MPPFYALSRWDRWAVIVILGGLLTSQAFANNQLSPAAIANTPITSRCAPNFTLVRDAGPNAVAQSLAPAEEAYISARTSSVLPSAWKAYLANVQASSPSELPAYVSSILDGSLTSSSPSAASFPRLGIASSGGGYRAAIFGAGILNAIDGRNASSRGVGTGGLLQASTYHSGLSGGSWLVGSLSRANFPAIQNLIFGSRGGIFEGGDDGTGGSSGGGGEGGGEGSGSGGGGGQINGEDDGGGGAPPVDPNPPGSGEGGPNLPPNPNPPDPPDRFFGGWNANFDLFAPNHNAPLDSLFTGSLLSEISGKFAAGFPVTFNDVYSRALSRHFVNGTNGTTANSFLSNTSTHGAGFLFSDIVNTPTFVKHQQPFPIVLGNSISRGQDPNIVYEFTPYEMGSFEPTLSAFVPTRFLGSRNSSVCVTNYDQAAFVLGTSSDLFSQFNTSVPALFNSTVGPLFAALNQTFPQPLSTVELDAAYYPNPFFGLKSDTFLDSDESFIRMANGGVNGEVVPLQPLLVKARGVDVILAIDASNGNGGLATGSALIAAQNRAAAFPSSYSFPPVPTTTETFLTQGLVNRPTFFGCDSAHTINSTTTDPNTPPLIIYIANGGPPPGEPALTNTSNLQLQYESEQIQGILNQVFTIGTQGIPPSLSSSTNSTKRHNNHPMGDKDPEWAACLACAIVDRARARSGVQRSGVCVRCLERYCWNGSEVGGGGSGSGSGSGSGTGVPGSGGGGSGSGTGTNGTGTGSGSGIGAATSSAINIGVVGGGNEMMALLTAVMGLMVFML
ncbi:FabD/lysophospholipase-like protein [Rickenella mellea]|uniref:Lysophospholipase n=1 Tax=Rickenella mellea TaxID=50990 RepID=A0A4Y7PIP7_9AGAM|nr:FabD/lysophospholipase-like protein [Rickenella mellea]